MLIKLFSLFFVYIFTGIVIKYLDDFTDREANMDNFPYFIMLFSCAALINTEVAVCLLWAAYGIGMTPNLKIRYAYNLSGVMELAVIFIAGSLVFGLLNFLYYLILMLFIQLTDDLIDIPIDKFDNNYAKRFGTIEALLISLNLLLLLIYLNPYHTIIAIVAYTLLQCYYYYRRRVSDVQSNFSFFNS
ncbi:hypothetical protein PRVXH_001315 [Proteinivorax hydrogeniformans]|uniref:Integral membrane protein n=1 Tax=Proteinivorax hydrogeniformans TaxID=1826727 RepID=A0AAU8HX41_9FIRM